MFVTKQLQKLEQEYCNFHGKILRATELQRPCVKELERSCFFASAVRRFTQRLDLRLLAFQASAFHSLL